MKEVFEDLKGYEDTYQISEFGRIFSKRRLVGNKIIFGREIEPQLTSDGYLKVTLSKDGTSKRFYVHRLVAMQFIDNINNLILTLIILYRNPLILLYLYSYTVVDSYSRKVPYYALRN